MKFNEKKFIKAFKENDLCLVKTCEILEISRGTFYHNLKNKKFSKEIDNLKNSIKVSKKLEEKRSYKKFNEVLFLKEFEKNLNILNTCKKLNISKSSFYIHIKKNPHFKELIQQIRVQFKELVLSDTISLFRDVMNSEEEIDQSKKDMINIKVKVSNSLFKLTNEYVSIHKVNEKVNEEEVDNNIESNIEIPTESSLYEKNEVQIIEMLENRIINTYDIDLKTSVLSEIAQIYFREERLYINKLIYNSKKVFIDQLGGDNHKYSNLLDKLLLEWEEDIEMINKMINESLSGEKEIPELLKEMLSDRFFNKKYEQFVINISNMLDSDNLLNKYGELAGENFVIETIINDPIGSFFTVYLEHSM